MKKSITSIIIIVAILITNQTIQAQWMFNGTFAQTQLGVTGTGIGFFPGPPSFLSALHVNTNFTAATANFTPGEVFRTDCPLALPTYWRMHQGGSLYGTIWNDGGFLTPHFRVQADAGSLIFHAWGGNAVVNNTNERMRVTNGIYNNLVTGTNVDNVPRVSISYPSVNFPTANPRVMLTMGMNFNTSYRNWMDIGTYYDAGDCMYTGLKEELPGGNILNRLDAVIAWGNDTKNPTPAGPDFLRFIFLNATGATQALGGGQDGLEVARISPYGHFGVGNFYNDPNYSIDLPDTRLEVLVDQTTDTALSPLVRYTFQQEASVLSKGIYTNFRETPNGDYIIDPLELNLVDSTTRIMKQRYVGIHTNIPTNTLEINSERTLPIDPNFQPQATIYGFGPATGWAGLTFTDLTTKSVPELNPGSGILAVDSAGDVIYVPDGGGAGGGNICNSPHPQYLLADWEIPMSGHNYRFANIYDLGGTVTTDLTPYENCVGIGTICNPLRASLQIDKYNTNPLESDPTSILINQKTDDLNAQYSHGVKLNLSGANPSNYGAELFVQGASLYNFGLEAHTISNANSPFNNFAVFGDAENATQDNVGVYGLAHSSTGDNHGGHFDASSSSSINYGVVASATSTGIANYNYGVRATADGALNTNFGVYTTASHNAINNFGIYSTVDPGPPVPFYPSPANIAIYGHAAYSSTPYAITSSWAGYFDGNVMINGLGMGSLSGLFTTSDQMFKTQIDSIPNTMSIIRQLKPRQFYFDTANIYGMNFSHLKQYGFIAQDVETILPELVMNTLKPSDIDSAGNIIHPSVTYKSLNYNAFIALLLRGMQEQQRTIDSLTTNNTKQDSINNYVQHQIAQLTHIINDCCERHGDGDDGDDNGHHDDGHHSPISSTNVKLTDAQNIVLEQNVPNPFAEQTIINYSLPDKTGKAQILFYNASGKLIQSVELSTNGSAGSPTGKGQLNVFAQDLSNGMYTYTLIADGKIFDTKKMVKQ